MSDRFTVTLNRQAESLPAEPGQQLIEVLAENGIFLRTDCGGMGNCQKCRVTVDGQSRLACGVGVERDLSVDIPDSSLVVPEVTDKPPVHDGQLTDLAPAGEGWGLAVDLGTTTIALYLCDLARVRVAGSLMVRNPQFIAGPDVISRIARAGQGNQQRERLQRMVVRAIEWGMDSLADSAEITRMVVVGNPAMLHLFLGEDPSSLGVSPFRPAFVEARTVESASLGFGADLPVSCLPLISGFVGSDMLAAALAVDLMDAEPGCMLVDIGTNGEIMLRATEGILACSCATGPAFEGATLQHGMPAVSGAIQSVTIDRPSGQASLSVIQRNPDTPQKTAGLCGSGAVSLVAELIRTGLLKSSGRLETEYMLTDSPRRISFTQKDVRAIQLGKGALRTGIDLLCREAGLEEPSRLLTAGAFGNHLDPEDAMEIGMFPRLAKDRVTAVGNAAGLGAVRALCDPDILVRASRLAAATRVVNLAAQEDFQRRFLANQDFPGPES